MNWEQIKLIFLLRWQLTRNQWTRGRAARAVVAALVAVAGLLIAAASFVGCLLGAAFGFRDASPTAVMVLWFVFISVFLMTWTISVLSELQRSETIDLQRLMHLPVALGQVFLFNYLASHLALSIIIAVPAAIGLSIGLAIARGPLMWLMLPLALSMIFMITAWTYCFRGWLATLMTNPRRRRTVIMTITLVFILLAQGPNIYFNVLQGGKRSQQKQFNEASFKRMVASQEFIPPLWVSVGARGLAEGNPFPSLLGFAGCFAIGAVGLRRAYRGTMKFYYGEAGGKAPSRVTTREVPKLARAGKSSARFVELNLPLVPQEASAVATASFRSMLRAPEIKITWGSALVVTVILIGSLAFRSLPKLPPNAKPFAVPAAGAFSLMMLVQFLANQFGFDREGFRALVLSPMSRAMILLGKTLAALPVMIFTNVALLILFAVVLHLSALTILAAFFQIASMWVIAGICGNLLSILVPYRIQSGSLKPTKMPGLAMLIIGLSQFAFPMLMLPVFVPPLMELIWRSSEMPSQVPVNLIFSTGLFALVLFLYWQLLPSLGRLLERRERKILEVVTAEVE